MSGEKAVGTLEININLNFRLDRQNWQERLDRQDMQDNNIIIIIINTFIAFEHTICDKIYSVIFNAFKNRIISIHRRSFGDMWRSHFVFCGIKLQYTG